jgi:hypothetical protein
VATWIWIAAAIVALVVVIGIIVRISGIRRAEGEHRAELARKAREEAACGARLLEDEEVAREVRLFEDEEAAREVRLFEHLVERIRLWAEERPDQLGKVRGRRSNGEDVDWQRVWAELRADDERRASMSRIERETHSDGPSTSSSSPIG